MTYVYRNLAFKVRDYETTNIVAARTNGAPPQDGRPWQEVSEAELPETIIQLWRQSLPGGQDVAYLGYL